MNHQRIESSEEFQEAATLYEAHLGTKDFNGYWIMPEVEENATRSLFELLHHAEPRRAIAFIQMIVNRWAMLDREIPHVEGELPLTRIYSLNQDPGLCVGGRVANRLFARRLPFTVEDLTYIFDRLGGMRYIGRWQHPYLKPLLRAVELQLKADGLTKDLRKGLDSVRQALEWSPMAVEVRLREQIATLLLRAGHAQEGRDATARPDDNPDLDREEMILAAAGELNWVIKPGEAWADQAVLGMCATEDHVQTWKSILEHCMAANQGSPNKKWMQHATKLLDALGGAHYRTCFTAWVALLDKTRTAPLENQIWIQDGEAAPHVFDRDNLQVLKGLAWFAGADAHPDLARPLGTMAISAYRKLPGIGPRAPRVGNSALWALGNLKCEESLAQLALLKTRVKYIPAQKLVAKAYEKMAGELGVSLEEIEELSVPTFGFTGVGELRETAGEYEAHLTLDGTRNFKLAFVDANGKELKGVPAAVKRDHAELLKDLQNRKKDAEKVLTAQRERLDNLYRARRTWKVGTWRERYLNHPLVGTLARRLIWRFTKDGMSWDAVWVDGHMMQRSGEPLPTLDDGAALELWHPLGLPVNEVLGWRGFLAEFEIRQPFKQAHREIYPLTEAERRTRTYSNRFASHIIRQHQANALAQSRGWRTRLHILADQEFPPPYVILERWDLVAEFWVDGVGTEWMADTNEAGAFLLLATDQVRFYRLREWHVATGGSDTYPFRNRPEPIPVEEVPPLAFSEVMRDVDLIVGVGSVGNNPQWSDGGPEGRFRDYWYSYSFGELGATALTRRDVLAGLLPRLKKLKGRWELTDRYLIIRGDVRTYKIHLGSGNILMEPNDQYLCIVASRRTDDTVKGSFLPFEGDGILSLIVSKALLLAEDAKITDETILWQIKPQKSGEMP